MKKTVTLGAIKISAYLFSFFALIGLISCNGNGNKQQTTTATADTNPYANVVKPPFNADSAYKYIKKQVSFGPRVPGTKAQVECKNYLVKKLKSFGLDVIVQSAKVTVFTGKQVPCYNIICRYKPKLTNRLFIFSHWDSRPFADQDTVNQDKPILAADDGGSGIAVILELARQLQIKHPNIGVDFLLDDVEDYGQPENSPYPPQQNTWCLGTQYFANNLPIQNFNPQFGILLDMVGASGAIFPKEGTSMQFAPQIVNKVWAIADQLGFSNYFINTRTPETIDDHYYVNQMLHIPSIDIVHYNPQTNDYPYFHHTHQDNMSIIDKHTLKVVGQTVYAVILYEANKKIS